MREWSENTLTSRSGPRYFTHTWAMPRTVRKLRSGAILMLLIPSPAWEVKWHHKPFLQTHLCRCSGLGSSNVASGISTVWKALVLLLGIWSGRTNKCLCGELEAQGTPLQVRILFCTTCTSVASHVHSRASPVFIPYTYIFYSRYWRTFDIL